ncbi:MAG: GNAT family N-acetyltransferase [Clostridia bacterium]|nr:GNAT family N-acetyltransferase [Clostridia bacterium]
MEIRKAELAELDQIMTVYADARDYMRESGNKTQWSGGYPSEGLVRADIAAGLLYVVTDDGDASRLLGVFYYREGNDPTYEKIYEGRWQNDDPYGVIHRIAVSKDSHGKGVAAFCFSYCYALCGNLRIDTHRRNLPMQRSLAKNGFVPCGIIYLESGDERLAYQKCES